MTEPVGLGRSLTQTCHLVLEVQLEFLELLRFQFLVRSQPGRVVQLLETFFVGLMLLLKLLVGGIHLLNLLAV